MWTQFRVYNVLFRIHLYSIKFFLDSEHFCIGLTTMYVFYFFSSPYFDNFYTGLPTLIFKPYTFSKSILDIFGLFGVGGGAFEIRVKAYRSSYFTVKNYNNSVKWACKLWWNH